MSVVTIQIGQCGNQVGHQFFSKVLEDCTASRHTGVSERENIQYVGEAIEQFFYTPKAKGKPVRARAVLVDTESKVIGNVHQAAADSRCWEYGEDSSFFKQRGAGNNWAQGYRVYGPGFQERLSELVRREVGRCERLSGFLSVGSLAGGTGSGLGAYVCEMLRDEYPHSSILAEAVWPYRSGEIIVQNYNALLSLSHLYQTADGLLIMENDWLHRICSSSLNMSVITMKDINAVIAHQMAALLLPVDSGQSVGGSMSQMLARISAGIQYKLLSLRTAPIIADACLDYTTYTWTTFIKLLRQMLLNNSFMERGLNWADLAPGASRRGSRCVSNLLVLRGRDCDQVTVEPLTRRDLYVPWVPPQHQLSVWRQARYFDRYECSASLLTNGQSCISPLEAMVSKAWQMFAAGAYLHRYTHYGMEETDFMDCFASLEQVLCSYKDL